MVTRDQVRYAKPDPDLFLTAADRRLASTSGTAIVVGDSVWDLLAARGVAGALGIGFLSGGYGRGEELIYAGAFRVYEDPARPAAPTSTRWECAARASSCAPGRWAARSSAGADRPAEVAEGGQRNARWVLGQRTGAEGGVASRSRSDVGLAEARPEASADHHSLHVKHVHGRGDPGSQRG